MCFVYLLFVKFGTPFLLKMLHDFLDEASLEADEQVAVAFWMQMKKMADRHLPISPACKVTTR